VRGDEKAAQKGLEIAVHVMRRHRLAERLLYDPARDGPEQAEKKTRASMSLVSSIEDVFGAEGPIARSLPGFEARPGQVAMAQLVERGFLEQAHTIVEAGTGVGKSLAYLVPALRSGKKIVISTGTIALQEQLVTKDLPLVTKALGINPRVELLKGRNHYLCREKFDRMSAQRLVAPSASMERLWAWAERTTSGDRAELSFVPASGDWEELDAEADDCVGELCPRFGDCFFFRRRDAARYADVVVVNHALFFLDLAMGGGLLPPYEYVVLDEAHQCERYAMAALTATLSPHGVGRVLRRLNRTYHLPASHDLQIEEIMRQLTAVLGRVPGDRYPVRANEHVEPILDELREAFYKLENWLDANWAGALRRPSENPAEVERRRDLAMRGIVAHIGTIDRIVQSARESGPDTEAIAWVERDDMRYEINAAPFVVGDFLRATLFARTPSVVLTSATIANGSSFAFLKESLGLDDAQELIAPSPFDYPEQARLLLAPSSLNPKLPSFAARAAALIEEALDRSRGRAFVLFTSYARLNEIYALLKERLPYPAAMQGDRPRPLLLEWFRSTSNAVLFATGTFWEGIDVAGEQLSCVIIDRLPFPSPSDPIVAARLAALEARGRNGFESLMIPTATMRLKQGFGRLIRSKTDRGLVVLLDGRASGMRYGQTIIDALPPARRIDDFRDLDGFFR
jgi:ATP-dependent DNA helicase DinG